MKALTIKQPWAWLIVSGHKDIENRSWGTRHRGRFFVHAGKTMSPEGLAFSDSMGIELPDLKLGAIIGEASIVDVVDSSDSPWWIGPKGFLLADQKEYEEPTEMNGKLSFWVPDVFPACCDTTPARHGF